MSSFPDQALQQYNELAAWCSDNFQIEQYPAANGVDATTDAQFFALIDDFFE